MFTIEVWKNAVKDNLDDALIDSGIQSVEQLKEAMSEDNQGEFMIELSDYIITQIGFNGEIDGDLINQMDDHLWDALCCKLDKM